VSHPSDANGRRPNHLEGQTSPYLLQHLYNPVDWYPWSPEALERARAEEKPIFLSIGYAACHWCHVMERECFEDPRVASLLNRHFVSIKVDREERPDIDEIYMNAVQLMTGSGGWPLNVFLLPDLRPFVGGTYFPPVSGHGRIGFPELLQKIVEAWISQRDELDRSAGKLTEHLRQVAAGDPGGAQESPVGPAEIARAQFELTRRFDARWGGFGSAPKFPPDGAIELLLREHHRSGETAPLQMAERTLEAMALGGIYDQVGGGFARYSVDERWLVPHFEKMLYNQALLVPLYVDAWLLTGKPLYRRVVEETLDFVRRELTGPDGGCYSSLDADSEGVEGKFYVWTPDEVTAELGEEDGGLFCEIYRVTAAGNFEGRSIPNLLEGSLADRAAARGISEEELVRRLEPLKRRLLTARERRVRPGTDDKVLTAWNGLMVTAFARAHRAFGRDADLAAARGAASFVTARMMRGDRLLVSHREGSSQLNAYLDDYAFFIRGLIDLYEAAFDPADLETARTLALSMLRHFEDPKRGGFYFTSDDHEELLTRNRSSHDGALPSGAGVAAQALLRLGLHLDLPGLRDAGARAIRSAGAQVARAPSAHAAMLVAADYLEGPVIEVAVVGEPGAAETQALLDVPRGRYLPRLALAAGPPRGANETLALLKGKTAEGNRSAAHVCRDYACRRPVSDPGELRRQLEESGTDPGAPA
jgi:uncharacterized protein YyaL (SSP411 family)